MDNIIYINELGYSDGKHKFDSHRLPQAYIEFCDWYSISYENFTTFIPTDTDILIFQTPTNNELIKLKLILSYVNRHDIYLTQEGNIFDWFDWGAEEQSLYIEILSKCKAFLYHNEFDKKVMKAFCDSFIKYPGCTNIFADVSKSFNFGQYVIIPNPIKRYQRGMIGHKLTSECVIDMPIYAMKYKKQSDQSLSFPDEYKLNNITLIDRMDVTNWYTFIYNCKFGVDIHREFSGGNCCLEFASLASPLIGNINLDVQRDLFPDISFDYMDYDNIKKAISLLSKDVEFYEMVSKKSLNNVKTMYNSKTITDTFKKEFKT